MVFPASPLRQIRSRHRAPRAAWVRSWIPLVICGLVLLASPARQAAVLGLHVNMIEHEGAPPPSAPRPSTGHSSATAADLVLATMSVRHVHAGHEHTHEPPHAHSQRPAPAEDGPQAVETPITSITPHEHNGEVHTHEPSPSGDPATLTGSPGELYLVATVDLPHPPRPDLAPLSGPARRPVTSVRTLDPPPPRGRSQGFSST